MHLQRAEQLAWDTILVAEDSSAGLAPTHLFRLDALPRHDSLPDLSPLVHLIVIPSASHSDEHAEPKWVVPLYAFWRALRQRHFVCTTIASPDKPMCELFEADHTCLGHLPLPKGRLRHDGTLYSFGTQPTLLMLCRPAWRLASPWLNRSTADGRHLVRALCVSLAFPPTRSQLQRSSAFCLFPIIYGSVCWQRAEAEWSALHPNNAPFA